MDSDDISYKPDAPLKSGEPVRTTIHFSKEDMDDIDFFAELWSAYDRLYKQERRKWSTQAMVEKFVKAGLKGLWAQMKISRPETEQERAALLKKKIEQRKKELGEK